jgi:hypothetical protein
MTRYTWIFIGVLLAGTAGASAAFARTPRAQAYDIVTQATIPAGASCGHYAWNDGNGMWGLDWAVNGVVVEENAQSGINYQNDGSPYTVAFGEVSGGVFTAWYSETFYPVSTGDPPIACLEL